MYFNPLPPYGGRLVCASVCPVTRPFQSTPSVWRETPCLPISPVMIAYFNPLPPYGGRPLKYPETVFHKPDFNPLPPYGGRQSNVRMCHNAGVFQSTPSVWRETQKLRRAAIPLLHFNPLPPYGGRLHYRTPTISVSDISIHSLRMEGDEIGV